MCNSGKKNQPSMICLVPLALLCMIMGGGLVGTWVACYYECLTGRLIEYNYYVAVWTGGIVSCHFVLLFTRVIVSCHFALLFRDQRLQSTEGVRCGTGALSLNRELRMGVLPASKCCGISSIAMGNVCIYIKLHRKSCLLKWRPHLGGTFPLSALYKSLQRHN